jgi:hypothetical protein
MTRRPLASEQPHARHLHHKLTLLGQMNARRKVEFPTAYHEAGYVVALQGVAIRSVTIVPDKQKLTSGLCGTKT